MANECIPVYDPGQAVTCHADAAITGKQFVRVSAAKQAGSDLTPQGADQTGGGNVRVDQTFTPGTAVPAFGVADRDAALGNKVGALRAGVVPVTCGAAVTAGTRVMPDATGRAIPYAAGAGPDIASAAGLALTTTTAAGQEVLVDLEAV
jgi:hypothetical protein